MYSKLLVITTVVMHMWAAVYFLCKATLFKRIVKNKMARKRTWNYYSHQQKFLFSHINVSTGRPEFAAPS